jgi:hypothetical protein
MARLPPPTSSDDFPNGTGHRRQRERDRAGHRVRRDAGTKIKLAPPEYKGMVERNNQFLETSFLSGRQFASPADFNQQLAEWLERANARTVRSLQGRPVGLLETDRQAMIALPPFAPAIGLAQRVRLGRDYYVRVDTVDYSWTRRSSADSST